MADTSETDTPTIDDEDGDLLRKLKRWYRLDADHSADWRKEAEEDYGFVAGEQWDDKDVQKLKDASRPVITFNRIDPLIRSVAGEQINNAQEVRYIPREAGDARANELLTQAASWFRDQCDADDEESDAFWDASTCGLGWTDSRLDLDEDPMEPMPIIERIDPLEMFWDCDAIKRNLTDARRLWRVREMPIEGARRLAPEAADSDLDASWARLGEGNVSTSSRDDEAYDDKGDSAEDDDDRNVTIVQVQWWELAPVYKALDPGTGQMVEVAPEDFKRLKPRLDALGVPYIKLEQRVYRTALLGRTVLSQRKLKCPHFTFNAITGFRDRNRGLWYGLVRAMKDPQRWANKWLSQTLHIMNANAKGGVMMESDTVDDQAEFERTFAKMDMVTVVPSGTLSNPNGPKIKEKPAAQFPAGFFQLMTFAISSVRDVAGINLEMMGMREANQPASLEYQRRQAGVTILAQLFRSMRRYHRNQGKVLLYYIQNNLSDGRLVKIVGDEGAQYVPLIKQAEAKYDIIVDEGPSSPNQKERVWSLIGEKFWTLPPDIQLTLLDYSPFPESVVAKIKEAAKKSSEGPQAEMAQKMAQLEGMLLEAKVMLTQAQGQKAGAEAAQIASEIGQAPAGSAGPSRADPMIEMQKVETGRLKVAADAQGKAEDRASKERIAGAQINSEEAINAAWIDADAKQGLLKAVTAASRTPRPSPNSRPPQQ